VHLGFGRAVSGEILKERSSLAAGGVVFAAVPVSEGRVVGEIHLVSRGILGEPELAGALRAAAREAEEAAVAAGGTTLSDPMIKEAVRLAVRRVLSRSIGYKAEVLVALVPVARPS
jgi:mRNA degradation ribonuclease J1/J2